ncbi:sulfite exporter TauE/SafE family protein [Streptomyces sp. NPDC048172]|uniref:sulfite exporter TauE/SafE family protein n=1 Tax=Streptomyces sp. NPDC048172 TaxID=3365505 RepID=UPI00370FEE36
MTALPLVLALVAGALVGLALGGLGAGGGILAVPVLIHVLGFSPQSAATAALFVVALSSLGGLLAHTRAGTVRWRAGLLFAVAGMPPALAAGLLSAHLPGALLSAAFALVAALAALRMLRVREPEPAADRADRTGAGRRWPRVVGAGAGLGGLTGLLGVGGGFLAVPALVGLLAFPMAEAAGTSLLVVAANALSGLAGRAGGASGLDWAVLAPFAGAAVLGAWDGKRLAARLPASVLRRTFAWLLLAVAAAMLAEVTWTLAAP